MTTTEGKSTPYDEENALPAVVSIASDGITCCSEACGLCCACVGVVPAVLLINTHGHAPHCDQQISVADSSSKQPFRQSEA